MSDLQVRNLNAMVESVALQGDLSGLRPNEKVAYISAICERLGLDPVTQPFLLVKLQGKEVIYAGRSCTSQLNKIHSLSHEILSAEKIDNIYIVRDRCTDLLGRSTEEIGAVSIENLSGNDLANAIMKARTKAIRRATLSHVGLGVPDETELETIRNVTPINMNHDKRDELILVLNHYKSINQLIPEEMKETTDKVIKWLQDNENAESNEIGWPKAIAHLNKLENVIPESGKYKHGEFV